MRGFSFCGCFERILSSNLVNSHETVSLSQLAGSKVMKETLEAGNADIAFHMIAFHSLLEAMDGLI